MHEAINLFFDYENDTQYFAEIDNNFLPMLRDEMLLALNYRNARRGIECVVDGCNMPLWAEDYELIRSIDTKKKIKFSKLLAKYTCGTHEGIYESMMLKTDPLVSFDEEYYGGWWD